MIRVLLVAAIMLGAPIYGQGRVVVDDPRTNPDAAAAVSALRFDLQVHSRVGAADEPPRVVAYSTETIHEDDSPRTKLVYDDYDSAEHNEPNHGRYGRNDHPSHEPREGNEYPIAATAVDVPEPQIVPAHINLEQYRPPNRQDSHDEQSPVRFEGSDHGELNHGRYVRAKSANRESRDRKGFPAVAEAPPPAAVAIAEEPDVLIMPDFVIQDHPRPRDRQESRREQSPGDIISEEIVDSEPAPAPAKPMVQHHLQDAKRRIMLKAIGIELAETMIIPDVLPPKFEPEFNISIKFNNKPVEMGQLLTINDTRTEPTIEFDTQPGQIFTLAMVDPDAPSNSRHGYRSYRHFLISNLDMSENSTSTVITTYQGPQPEFGTGAHRYALVVLKQRDHLNLTAADVPESRVRFDIVDWGNKRKMKPVAASYFMVKRNHVGE
ncbi:hypothetical protein GGI19_000292 [Coemansia pectinata]|uniref:Uncharacterized protein n=1 Tax=Coemansia pectinata TaxID=1052879 RepID=A0A9W8H726_9FUNG|nr:hypothetical protein GGI19_000292 [Coemansia pectinata]